MTVFLALAALLLSPAAAAALDCKKNPRKALPLLTARALAYGDKEVLNGAPEQLLGWAAPSMLLIFPVGKKEDGIIYDLVVTRDDKGVIVPERLLLTTLDHPGKDRLERWMFRAGVGGELEMAGKFKDELDEERRSTGTDLVKLGPHDPRAAAAYARTLNSFCKLAADKTPSNQEKLATINAQLAESEKRQRDLKAQLVEACKKEPENPSCKDASAK